MADSDDEKNDSVLPPKPSTVESTLAVHSARVRLPPFWTNDPDTWFLQAEAQFAVTDIRSDHSKFYHVVTALPQEVCASVAELLRNPPEKKKYDAIKRALTSRHTLSAAQRLELLVDKVELGDRKPSEAYWQMINLAGETYDEALVRTLWLRRLPKSLYIALTAIGDKSIDKILQVADQIYEATGPSVSSIRDCKPATSSQRSLTPPTDPMQSTLVQLQAQIATMQTQLGRLSMERSRSPRPRARLRSFSRRSRSGSRRRFIDKQGACFYHSKFGSAARKCYFPCKHKYQNVSTNQDPKN